MKRIELLPEFVKRKIAAGEVVEGPFSVIKELVENSLDSGATRIEVAVIESGLKRIEVTDNGSGIPAADMPLAVAEHATSKISAIEDIENVSTFGFRGEALSSIAAVSKCTILSRHVEEQTGARLESGDDGVSVREWAGPAGTSVIVENLFYNVPARKKFLKSVRTEMASIRNAFIRLAVPHPDRYFSLESDDGRKIILPPVTAVRERLVQVFGQAAAAPLVEESLQDIRIRLSGFFSPPDAMRSSRSMQLFYVNRRPVEHRYLGGLLSRAYETAAPGGRHPAAILFMEIDPALLDVNVHPAKREVRVFDQRHIDGLIASLVRKALDREFKIPTGLFHEPRIYEAGGGLQAVEVAGYATAGTSQLPFAEGTDATVARVYGSGGISAISGDAIVNGHHDDFTILGVAFGAYIVYERSNSLYLMDFHAAHERILYDTLLASDAPWEGQVLAFPLLVELSIEDHALVMENISHLTQFGFDIDDFGGHVISIRAVPALRNDPDPEGMLREIVGEIKEARGGLSVREKTAASIACHGAHRAGDRLLAGEAGHLVTAFAGRERELRCPHGRPFVYCIDRSEIERIFRRK